MAMEPPPKRRRKAQLPLDQEDEEDEEEEEEEEGEEEEDDDELSLHPFEVEAKRDPGYKFSIERAYADQRFQATMAHIFEKYGRDFDGIGDEIDLVTGKIVVNNGHVHNMRNEGDVGDYLVEEKEDDEDGILLEDLVDDEEEEEEEEKEGERDAEAGPDDGDEEEEEDRIMQGREPSRHSTALVPKSGSQARFFPGQPPFSYGPAPPGPWGLPDQFSDPLWDHPDFTVARRPPTLGLAPGRYNFPVQNGQSSIWAPRSRFKDDGEEPLRSAFTAAFGKHLAMKKTKPRKSILPPSSRKPADDHDEDDEAILTGKAPGKPPGGKVIDATDDDDDDDDMLLSGRRSTSKPEHSGDRKGEEEKEKESSGNVKKATQSTRRSRKRKRRTTEDPTHERGSAEEASGSQAEAQSQQSLRSPEEDSQGTGDRRRSGRPRKQVEFLNKISWAEALEQSSLQRMTVVLPSIDPQSREDYNLVDSDVHEDQSTLSNNESSQTEANGHNDPDKTIPDSQNTSSSTHDEHALHPDVSDPDHDLQPGNSKHPDTDSACVLSDDEAPTLLSKPRSRRQTHHHTVEDSAPVTVEATGSLEEADEQAQQQEAEYPSPLQREQPELSLDDGRASDETTGVDIVVHNQPAKPRRLGRRESKRNLATDNHAVQEASPEPEEATCLPSEDPCSAVPPSSSPTRALTRITAEVSLDDDRPPRRLSREVRWLKSRTAAILSSSPTARDGVGSPEITGSVRRRDRSRKSAVAVAVIEQPVAPTEAHQDERGGEGGGGGGGGGEGEDIVAISPVLEESPCEAAAEEPQVDAALPSPRRTQTASPIPAQTETPGPSPSKLTTTTPLLKLTSSSATPSLFPKNPQTPPPPHHHPPPHHQSPIIPPLHPLPPLRRRRRRHGRAGPQPRRHAEAAQLRGARHHCHDAQDLEV